MQLGNTKDIIAMIPVDIIKDNRNIRSFLSKYLNLHE